MGNDFSEMIIAAPAGFPENVRVPQFFLHQINTSVWIHTIQVVLVVAFLICLLYACNAPYIRRIKSRKEEQKEGAIQTDDEEKEIP